MGICSSSDSSNVSTAKLILSDGRLLEFSYPVKVCYILERDPASFICNADEMDFNDVVSAIDEEEELELGHLYFSLPLNKLNQPLNGEEMAALAVKASSALMKCGSNSNSNSRSRNTSVSPFVFSKDEFTKLGKGKGKGKGRVNRSNGRRNFTARLSAIPE